MQRPENMYWDNEHLKTITVPVGVGALGIIKKGTDKYINNIPCSPSLYETKKKYFAERFISVREY